VAKVNPKDGKKDWIDKLLGTVVFRLPWGNDGRGTPVMSGALLMFVFVLLPMGYFAVKSM